MGMTFSVDTTVADEIVVEVEVARYVPAAADGGHIRTSSVTEEAWQREPISVAPRSIKVSVADRAEPIQLSDNLRLFVRVRQANADGVAAVTLALINTCKASANSVDRDATAFFQPSISVRATDGSSPFVERPSLGSADSDEELNSYRLLYRHAPIFATGHGCAVEWEPSEVAINDMAAKPSTPWIRTTFIPTHDLRLADSNPTIDTGSLRMHRLATASDAEVISALQGLTSGYRRWIEHRMEQSWRISDDSLQKTAVEHLERCRVACSRMDAGIELLANSVDPTPMEAFRLANQAMAMQRARTEWLKSPETGSTSPDESVGVWRPFQVAFILLSLQGIADHTSDDRNIADVLWFPTGGGKTEAYLGLIAFATFLRRLRDPLNGGGVTVLMRYTLRLLTVQQFERAALLMCCMERLRRDRPERLHRHVGRSRIHAQHLGRSQTCTTQVGQK
jgi:hypothetical protein